jgi:uncharacterized protein
MSLTSRLVSRLMHLPPAHTHDLVIQRAIKIPMPDGAELLADYYAPRSGGPLPTLLVRSPYGRKGLYSALYAFPFAEHGYQVLMQSCRGTAGSGGQFCYARHEHDDGLATIAWIKQQPWFSGELVTAGASYLGFTQWAMAADAGPELKAMVPQVSASDLNHYRFQGGSLTLEVAMSWATRMTLQAARGLNLETLLLLSRLPRRLERAYGHLPLGEADQLVVDQSSQPFQDLVTHGPEDAYWKPTDWSGRVAEVQAPVYLMAGWYDFFLDWQLKDYQALRGAGKKPSLLIGPWTHISAGTNGMLIREALAWLDTQVKGKPSKEDELPVRLFVMGEEKWRQFADWPPPARPERWYLHPGGQLLPGASPHSEPDHYRYDPADPTPAVGGNSIGPVKRMGAQDNRKLEARSDVLVYTSAELTHELEVIGPVKAEVYVHSSSPFTDFFVRLCVVKPSGRSINLCDGLVRLTPGSVSQEPDGSLRLSIELWPTAYHFQKGERLRVQVSSGAHPRFMRNLGSGEPLATGIRLVVADQTVYHDPLHPSAIVLPVLSRA